MRELPARRARVRFSSTIGFAGGTAGVTGARRRGGRARADGVDRRDGERVGRAVREAGDREAGRGRAGVHGRLRRGPDVRRDPVAGDRAAAVGGRGRPGQGDGAVARGARDARRGARHGRRRRRDQVRRGRVRAGARGVEGRDRERVGRAVREPGDRPGRRRVARVDRGLRDAVDVRRDPVAEIGLPPSETGAVQLSVTEASAAVAVSPVGGPAAAPAAVSRADAAESGPLPAALLGETVKVYAVPFVRPATVKLVGGRARLDRASAPSRRCTA